MNSKASVSTGNRISSGIDMIDTCWGGLYRGGTYVVFGRSGAGRGLLTLLVAAKGCDSGEEVVLVSPVRAKDLLIQASSIGFDIRDANRRGSLRIMRTPPLLGYSQSDDKSVSQALGELAALIKSNPWYRVVVSDFMPFARFKSFEAFQLAFLEFLEDIGESESCLLLGMPEPANDHSRSVIDFMSGRATASIYVSGKGLSGHNRTLTLAPNYGHATRELEGEWDLESIVDAAEQLEHGREQLTSQNVDDGSRVDLTVATERAPKQEDLLIKETSFKDSTAASTATDIFRDLPAWRRNGRFISKDGFKNLLHDRFRNRSDDTETFLLIALRMDHRQNGTSHPYTFDFVVDLVRDSIRESDRALVDEQSERIVICISPREEDESHHFFARVKEKLRARIPDYADDFLHAVSAIVVPNGRPFGDEEEFLKFVFS